MIGFVHKLDDLGTMENHKISCFYGSKDKSQLYEDQVAPVNLGQGNQTNSTLETSEAPSKRGAVNLYDKHNATAETDDFIAHINGNQNIYGWKANTCMLQKSHKDYHCDSEHHSFVQTDGN
jgi:hypothetical protein